MLFREDGWIFKSFKISSIEDVLLACALMSQIVVVFNADAEKFYPQFKRFSVVQKISTSVVNCSCFLLSFEKQVMCQLILLEQQFMKMNWHMVAVLQIFSRKMYFLMARKYDGENVSLSELTYVQIMIHQFVIFKPLSHCFEETIRFDVKASFASRPVLRLIRWYNKPGDITKEFW